MNKICKECQTEKSLDDFYAHPLTLDKRSGRCKECTKSWRRSERERSMSRIIDNKRSNKPERIEHLYRNTVKFRSEHPEKYKAHRLVWNRIKELKKNWWVKPTISYVSWLTHTTIHLHHFDYTQPYKVIPCTPIEHRKFHSWLLEVQESYILDLEIQ